MACLDDATIAAFADGALRGEALRRAEEHIDGCDDCRDLVVGVVQQPYVDAADTHSTTTRVTGGPTNAEPQLAPPSSQRAAWRKDEMVAQYRILRHLGRGGAGEVYAA